MDQQVLVRDLEEAADQEPALPVVKAPNDASMPAMATLPPSVAVDCGSRPTMMGAAAMLAAQLNRLSFCAFSQQDLIPRHGRVH